MALVYLRRVPPLLLFLQQTASIHSYSKMSEKLIPESNKIMDSSEDRSHETESRRRYSKSQRAERARKELQQTRPVTYSQVADFTSGVSLSEVFARDPLAILLQTPLQMYEPHRCFDTINSIYCDSYTPAPAVVVKASSSGCTVLPNVTDRVGVAHYADTSTTQWSCTSYPGTSSPNTQPPGGKEPSQSSDLPTVEQLDRVYNSLGDTLPRFFTDTPDYSIYDNKIIFENRIRGSVTQGKGMYATQLGVMRFIGHIRFAYVKFVVLKMTRHPEEGTVKIRWRIEGIKSRHALQALWTAGKLSADVVKGDKAAWYDGYSTFHVNSSGLVIRHVADNMMRDEDTVNVSHKVGATLAIMLGLAPRPAGHGSAIEAGGCIQLI